MYFLFFFCPTGWCWCYRQEDHCWHIWRLGRSWRRSVLWKRLLKGRPLCCLCCSLGGQVFGQSQAVQESSCSGKHTGGEKTLSLWSVFAASLCADKKCFFLPLLYITGVLCHWSGLSSVHLFVHLWFLCKDRDGAAPYCQQELWSAARSHRQVNTWI